MGSLKTGSTTLRASSSATTVFLISPPTIRNSAGPGQHRARVARRAQLRQQLVGAHDRPGHEVREEGLEDRHVAERRGPRLAAVDVHHVGDRLEGEERDADRQDDLKQRQRRAEPDRVERVVDLVDEEAQVLEDAEQPRSKTIGGDQRPLAGRPVTASGRSPATRRCSRASSRSAAGPSANPATRRRRTRRSG